MQIVVLFKSEFRYQGEHDFTAHWVCILNSRLKTATFLSLLPPTHLRMHNTQLPHNSHSNRNLCTSFTSLNRVTLQSGYSSTLTLPYFMARPGCSVEKLMSNLIMWRNGPLNHNLQCNNLTLRPLNHHAADILSTSLTSLILVTLKRWDKTHSLQAPMLTTSSVVVL